MLVVSVALLVMLAPGPTQARATPWPCWDAGFGCATEGYGPQRLGWSDRHDGWDQGWAGFIGHNRTRYAAFKLLDVADPNPFGSLDSAVAVDDESYRIRGWAVDPDLPAAAAAITPPGAPTAVSAVPDDGMAIVKFKDPPNGGMAITSYEYSLDGAAFRPLGTQQSPAVIPDLRNGRAYSIRLRAVSEAGAGAASEAVVVTPAVPQVKPGFTAVAPLRLADTRTDTMVPSGGVMRVKVAGAGGIPTDAQAAALNVTVTRATGPGWITVFPCGVTAPTASNLNYVAGQTVPNAVFTGIGSTGEVCLRAQTATHVIVDANGWFGAASSFAPITPTRLTDTRTTGPVAPGSVLRVKVAGRAGIPEDASTASLNVTVTGPSASGWLTVFPCGVAAPNASSLNFVAGQTVPNSVLTGIGTGGEVCLQPSAGTHVIVDVNGWYAKSSVFTAMTPLRMADTRAQGGPLPARGTLRLTVAGSGNVTGDAVAVSMNVTATGAAGSGWVTVYPCGGAVPQASNLNFVAGQTVPNAVVSGVGPGGEVCFYTSASTNLIVDVNGWFNPVRIAPGDVNKDGTVGCSDLAILLSDWGTTRPRGDLNKDGIVDINDLSLVLTDWSDTNKC